MNKDKYIIIRRRRLESGDCELSKLDYAPSAMNVDAMCRSALKNTEYDISPGDLLFAMDINHLSNFIKRSKIMYVVDHGGVVRPDQPRGGTDLSWLELWEVTDECNPYCMITHCCTSPCEYYIDKMRVVQACVACIKTLKKIYANNAYLKRVVELLEQYAFGGLAKDDLLIIYDKLPTNSDSEFIVAIRELCKYILRDSRFSAPECITSIVNCYSLMHPKEDASRYMVEVIREAMPLEHLFMAVSPRE